MFTYFLCHYRQLTPVFVLHLLGICSVIMVTVSAAELDDAERAFAAGNFTTAAKVLKSLVVQENPDALYLLGRMYEQGKGVELDVAESQRLYRLAADQGHYKSIERLSVVVDTASIPEENPVVLEWYLPAANEGDMDAQYNLGFMFETGWGGVPTDINKALRWYREAAQQQHDMAQLHLGMMYITEPNIGGSRDEGISLIRRAAENGSRVAEMLIQEIYDAENLALIDDRKIISGLRRIADEDESTQFIFESIEHLHQEQGQRVAEVQNTPPSTQVRQSFERVQSVNNVVSVGNGERSAKLDKATQLLDRFDRDALSDITVDTTQVSVADSTRLSPRNNFIDERPNVNEPVFIGEHFASAEQGDAEAQFKLGVIYMQGKGVEEDYEEGLRWINEAAAQDYPSAQTYLELWKNDFDINDQRDSIAVTWLKEAARALDIDALYRLGFLYERGRGVEANTEEANKWYQLAVSQGHQEAKHRIEFIQNGESEIGQFSNFNANGLGNIMIPTTENIALGGGVLVGCVFLLGGVVWVKRKLGLTVAPPSTGKPPGNIGAEDLAFMKDLWAQNDAITPSESSDATALNKTTPRETKESKAMLKAATAEAVAAKAMQEIIELKAAKEQTAKVEANVQLKPEAGKPELPATDRQATESPVKDIEIKDPVRSKEAPAQIAEVKPVQEQEEVKISSDSFDQANIESNKIQKSLSSVTEVGSTIGQGTKVILDANDIALNQISRETLTSSARISADTLVNQHVGIGGKQPREKMHAFDKLDAEELLRDAKNVFNEKLTRQKKNFAQFSVEDNDITIRHHDVAKNDDNVVQHNPVDINAPFTDQEERSLAEVHYNIGLMFLKGEGVPKNSTLAAKWYEKAAKENLPEAQYSLSELYQRGDGVLQDQNLSLYWLKKSAQSKHKEAQIRLMHLNNKAV